ncbi:MULTISPECIES: M56 family metallopeptidase [Catenuloplanes]|uniref:Peptidase M48 domain-containing protein n=1 Tax=Catenuloplanes niger TaxID=587534 RepID=A0AAE3ZU85_9ACTN|nr:M56 family metallopeptidase [Catenuloplanes niger]MDR7326178.1 hypothetical protein [Catenuloplanes niger]
MTVWVYVPIVLSAALALLARPIAAGSAPAAAARALARAALIAAVTSTASLILLVATLLDRLPPPLVARNEPGRPRLPEPVPDVVAITAVVLLMIALVRYGVDVRRRDAVHRGLRAAGRPGDDGVVVADWAAPFAVAIPGRPGHVLLTTGMIRLLTADERRVVLAHERAHLARRHHRLIAMASTAAALNPILLPARDAVSYLVERWADEEAATEVGDRHLTARSVAKAALATLDRPVAAAVPATGPRHDRTAGAAGDAAAHALAGPGGARGPQTPGVAGMHGSRPGHALGRVRAMTDPAVTTRRTRAGLIALGLLSLAFVLTDAVAATDFVVFATAWMP